MLISILGNALVLAAMIRTPSIYSTSMIMLCSLAATDLLVGFIVQPFYVAKEFAKNALLDNLAAMMACSVCVASLLTITAITVNRFFTIT